ncbi:MAG: hypothetical protein ACKO1V_02795 [Cyanobium sp.]
MPADPASAPSPQPLDGLSPSQRALLRIVCWVAWADGDFAAEERELLDKLVQRLLPADPGTGAAASVSALATEPPSAPELAVKLALPESEVEEAEWAARQELAQPRSLLELLGATLSGFGAWPALENGQLPPGSWL